MATVKASYTASATITCSIASEPCSATFIAGREGAVVSNITNLYDDVLLSGKVTAGATGAQVGAILVYVFAPISDDLSATIVYPGAMDGTDTSARSITTVGEGSSYLKLAASMTTKASASITYYFGPVSVAQLFGGIMPQRWSIWVTSTSNSGTNTMDGTAGNHFFKYVGVHYTVA